MRTSFSLLFIFIFMMVVGSKCDDNKSITFCGIKEPLKNIEWLKKRVDNSDKIEVAKLVYNNSEYIAINPCPGCPDNMTEIFDCQGNRFCTIGGITGKNTCPEDFLEKSEKILLIKKGD